MAGPTHRALISASAAARLGEARRWLEARAPGEEVLIVGATPDAAAGLIRSAVGAASFGWHRATLLSLAGRIAAPALAERRQLPVGPLAAEAVMARVLHEAGDLGRYAPLAEAPGLPTAAARTLGELRMAGATPEDIEVEAPELGRLLHSYEAALLEAGLIDRAGLLQLAAELLRSRATRAREVGLPTVLVDLPIDVPAESALLAALASQAPELLATAPAGDGAARRALEEIGLAPASVPSTTPEGALGRLQAGLFGDDVAQATELDDTVVVLSAPGEARECVEIARRIHACAKQGTRFDQIAVLLRAPEAYRSHLEEAFGRAGIPAHYARGAVQPDPAGRAFLSLLACAAENLTARRFAEYLSLGEVPPAAADGAPPAAGEPGEQFVAADDELAPRAFAKEESRPAPRPAAANDEAAPVAAGTLRAPRRWERLLVDAAVIGGRARWERRLEGRAAELQLDLDELEDPEAPAAAALRRELEDLGHLRAFALPLLDVLAALPEAASWGRWVEVLSALAQRALREPDRVVMVLSEILPMASVGPVGLAEVRLVLERRLLAVAVPPATSRHGRVFVAPAASARGLSFDVVFVPGLAEKIFPQKIAEDPLLLDARRRRLALTLPTNDERVASERRALHVAAGAAAQRLFLSYPRLDLDQGRPRVPSFYALEALRAAEGRLPGFDELAGRAERVADTRVGWPAPRSPEEAIDEAEHDLALLEGLLAQEEEESVGTARYLLDANPSLARALRFRARRWLPRYTQADGLIDPGTGGRAAIAEQRLGARPYSPTALQHFAACPYRFFLSAVQRLRPREEPVAIDEMDPLTRGSLFHDVQFALLTALREEGLLPVRAGNLPAAQARLDGALDAAAARYRDELAPAIPRVFDDGVAAVRADLREWLRRASEDESGFAPWRFELAFGLSRLRERDSHSVAEPVLLDCGLRVRGSIDLVERASDGRLRATDHKTGKERFAQGAVTAGGTVLQPILYALVAEQLFMESGAPVESGRLYYCTSAGGFSEREVTLGPAARESASEIARAIDDALAEPFLPAAPAPGACRFCDYRGVCGPYEEQRTARKWDGDERLRGLHAVRALP